MLLAGASFAYTQPLDTATPVPPGQERWFDRAQNGLHGIVWRSARGIDSWTGPPLANEVYQEASGSISVAAFWDEFDGFDAKVRFRVDLPLPQINERLHLFIGRVNPDEFVSERVEPLGTIPPLGREENEEDQTLAGLIYNRSGSNGSTFSASIGGRVSSGKPDPYVKTSYRFRRTLFTNTLFTVKETLFYQVSERFGATTRVDFERMLDENWRVRWTSSGTISQESEGVRGFSTLTATRSLPDRRALILRIGGNGETAAEVPLRDFGVKVAYRASVVRPWLVVECLTSVTWPKHRRDQARTASLGFGIGCEVYFGKDDFSSRPVTF